MKLVGNIGEFNLFDIMKANSLFTLELLAGLIVDECTNDIIDEFIVDFSYLCDYIDLQTCEDFINYQFCYTYSKIKFAIQGDSHSAIDGT